MTASFVRLRKIAAIAVVSSCSADAALAQAAAKPEPPPSTAQQQDAAKSPAPAAGGTSAVVMDLSAVQGLIGKSVTSSAGEDMGRIVDLLVTPSGLVRAAVIDFGGILGVGSRKVAVDWKALSFADVAKAGTIRLALTRDQVRMSPEYRSGDPIVILEATKPAEAKAAGVKPSEPKAVEPSKTPEPAGK